MSSVRNGAWFVPVVCVLGGVVLSFATIAIDERYDFVLIPRSLTGGPDVALAILSTVAASMVSLAALVLTITMVVVQLAMGQFSPRIVQTFLRDKPSQFAVGIFVATFTHAMLAMREVRYGGDGRVPGLAVAVAFILVLVSIAVLVLYVHHIGQSLRVAALIELVGSDTRRLLDEQYPPETASEEQPDDDVIVAPSSGVITVIDHGRLVDAARAADCTLELVVPLGSFVPAGAPLFHVSGPADRIDTKAVTDAVEVGLERTLDQDVAYGFRMLVDIAERSMADSPLQDPTTAIQAIDRLHDGLRQLARRRFPDGRHADDAGTVRLVTPVMDWDAYVHLSFDEIRIAGAGSPPVARRVRAAIEDLLTVAPVERRPVLRDQLARLEQLTGDALADDRDVELASAPDQQGIGVDAGSAAGSAG
ncbi:MAG TPA: DUF2254 domain-containing protein [Aquihabitans sp.]|nr:DUF2254 domain-containing protein [Aquihabitans sp.]